MTAIAVWFSGLSFIGFLIALFHLGSPHDMGWKIFGSACAVFGSLAARWLKQHA